MKCVHRIRATEGQHSVSSPATSGLLHYLDKTKTGAGRPSDDSPRAGRGLINLQRHVHVATAEICEVKSIFLSATIAHTTR